MRVPVPALALPCPAEPRAHRFELTIIGVQTAHPAHLIRGLMHQRGGKRPPKKLTNVVQCGPRQQPQGAKGETMQLSRQKGRHPWHVQKTADLGVSAEDAQESLEGGPAADPRWQWDLIAHGVDEVLVVPQHLVALVQQVLWYGGKGMARHTSG